MINMQSLFPLLSSSLSPARIGVESLYVISQDAGICLFQTQFGDSTPKRDTDLVSAFFMAVLKLGEEVTNTEVRSVHLGDGYLFFASSHFVVMILQAKKEADLPQCKALLERWSGEFNVRYKAVLNMSWNGNVTPFASFQEVIEKLNTKETALRQREESIAIRRYMWQLARRRGQKLTSHK